MKTLRTIVGMTVGGLGFAISFNHFLNGETGLWVFAAFGFFVGGLFLAAWDDLA